MTGDEASAPPRDRRFAAIAAGVLTGRFFGVPFFNPPVNPTVLFNVWAYLLGPFFFLFAGLWRKGLILLVIGALLYAPGLLPSDVSALVSILVEEYTPYHQALQGLALLLVAFACTGRSVLSLLVALLFMALFVYGALATRYLDLGIASAYVWLNAGIIWKALFQLCLFALLGSRWIVLAAALLAAGAFFSVGLPVDLPLHVFPAAAFPVFCGMMAAFDLYRKKLLGERFWWCRLGGGEGTF